MEYEGIRNPNSEDFKCNTCGDYVGERGVWGLCETCFDKQFGHLPEKGGGNGAWKDSWEMPRPRTLDIAIDAFNAMAQKDGEIDGTDR